MQEKNLCDHSGWGKEFLDRTQKLYQIKNVCPLKGTVKNKKRQTTDLEEKN
jgi:hypothetical protein